MGTLSKQKIIIVDNNELFRYTFEQVLKRDFRVQVEYAANAKELHEIMRSFYPDLIIYDLFSASNNFEATMRKIKLQAPNAKVVVLSYEVEREIIDFCIDNGVDGFFNKNITDIELVNNAIKKIIAGERVILNPAVVRN